MSDEGKTYCCPECGSDDLLFPAWVNEHGSMVKDIPDYFFICQDCGLQFSKPKEKEVA